MSIKSLEILLQNCLKDESLVLEDCKIEPLISEGENYSSCLYKLVAFIRRENSKKQEILHVAAKIPLEFSGFTNWPKALKKEVFVYEFLIPIYEKLQRDANINDNDISCFSPKYLGHRYSLAEGTDTIDMDSILLMENLKEQDYYTCNRFKGVDLDHAKKTVIAVGKYHALGIAFKTKEPEKFEKVKELAQQVVDMKQLRAGLENIFRAIEEDPSFYQFIPKINHAFQFVINTIDNSSIPKDPWATIVHGDFTIFNVMYHADSTGLVDKVKFVDYAGFMYSHPIHDLMIFIFTSVDLKTHEDHVDDLIEDYYTSFREMLSILGVNLTELLSVNAFNKELEEQAVFILPFLIFVLKILCSPQKNISGNNETIQTILSTQKTKLLDSLTKQRMLTVIKIFIKKQWI